MRMRTSLALLLPLLCVAGCGQSAAFWGGVLETAKPAVEYEVRKQADKLGLTPEATQELVEANLRALEEAIAIERAKHPDVSPIWANVGSIIGAAALAALGGGVLSAKAGNRDRREFHRPNKVT